MKKSLVIVVASLGVWSAGSLVVNAVTNTPVAEAKDLQPQKRCPVMGGEINKKLFVDYQDKRIYVCCKSCLKEVKQDPAKYVKQLEAEGTALDKAAK